MDEGYEVPIFIIAFEEVTKLYKSDIIDFGIETIPKHGHLNQLQSQKQAFSQVSQEQGMLESSATYNANKHESIEIHGSLKH